nr:EF-hand domain-containing protein [uncultured Sphingomonas sp.]
MWRYLVGGIGGVAMVAGGWLMWSGASPSARAANALSSPAIAATTAAAPQDFPAVLPEAPERSREQKRFDRYDKDRDVRITREEYLASRRKAFAKLDTDGDGRLSFDEWSIKTRERFATADRDRSGTLTAAEFATTAPKRKPPRPACRCPEPAPVVDD